MAQISRVRTQKGEAAKDRGSRLDGLRHRRHQRREPSELDCHYTKVTGVSGRRTFKLSARVAF
jgi:hypothetical protein